MEIQYSFCRSLSYFSIYPIQFLPSNVGSTTHLAVANLTIGTAGDSCPPDWRYDDWFCSYSDVSATGPGDSGSPFICEENGFAFLHGIHFGYGHGASIQNNVFKHLDFIKDYMAEFPEP